MLIMFGSTFYFSEYICTYILHFTGNIFLTLYILIAVLPPSTFNFSPPPLPYRSSPFVSLEKQRGF